jgi:predicted permease
MSVFRFWKPDVKRDIDDELRFHFEARIAELVSLGATPEAAREQAVAEFGDVDAVRTDLRVIDDRLVAQRRRADVLDGWRQDVTYAARSLRRTPAVSLAIVVTLALGLGANASMFSLLDVVLLRPPAGVAEPDGVRRLWSLHVFRSGAQYWSGYDYQGYMAVKQSLEGRADLAIYGGPDAFALGRGENPPKVNVSTASASYFSVLGVRPAFGRLYGPDEDRVESGAPVVVISDRLWSREFGSDPGVIGQEIQLKERPYTIIGIMPPRFSGVNLDAAEAWVPLASHPAYTGKTQSNWYQNPNINGFQVLMRLRPGVSEPELEKRATLALRQPGIGYEQDTATVARFGSIVQARGPGKVSAELQVAKRAGGVSVIVLLVAFANVVNLLLARAVRRRREIAVRLALGISSARLVRLLVTEGVLLSLAAAVAALAAAWWGGGLLRELLMPEVVWAENPLHWRVMLFGVVAAIVAGAAAALVPALQSRAPDLTHSLKTGVREGGTQRSRLRGFLVASQAALSVVLIVGAALFVRSLNNVRNLDIGYAVNRLGFVSVSQGTDNVRRAEISDRLLQLEERMASVPGVERVAYTSMRPKWGIQFTNFFPDGALGGVKHSTFYSAVSPAFFTATGTRVTRGRSFTDGAAGRHERAVLVNTALADSVWPGEDPIGRCIRFEKGDASCYTVIGVTQTTLQIGLKEQREPHVWAPITNQPFENSGVGDVVLRMDPDQLTSGLAQVRDLLRAEFPAAKVSTNTMVAAMEPEYRPWQLGATLFILFGALAALVAAIGVYSAVSYAVSQRTHEFGVRVALGATGGRIVSQVVGSGVRTVAIGIAAGILLALALGRIVASLLFGVSPGDPLAMAVAAGLLLAVAAAASFAPAWRAGRADPVTALRTD